MRALRSVLLAATLALASPLAFGWAATLIDDAACDGVTGTIIDFPEGTGTYWVHGTFGGATVTPVFMAIDGVTPYPIDPAETYTASMDGPLNIQFEAGQQVCLMVEDASGSTSIQVELHPHAIRTTDGNLKLRF